MNEGEPKPAAISTDVTWALLCVLLGLVVAGFGYGKQFARGIPSMSSMCEVYLRKISAAKERWATEGAVVNDHEVEL